MVKLDRAMGRPEMPKGCRGTPHRSQQSVSQWMDFLPLDIIEALTYGREWQIGYDKLPPLPWWLVEVAYRAFDSDIAYYALGQLSVLTAFAAVWAVMLRFAAPP